MSAPEKRVTVYMIVRNGDGTHDYKTLEISASQAAKATVRHGGDHLAICLAKMHADVFKEVTR